MTLFHWLFVAFLAWVWADAIVKGWDRFAQWMRERRVRNVYDSIAPFLTAEPYPPTMQGVCDALAAVLPISEVALIEFKVEPRVLIHIRITPFALLGLGFAHLYVRRAAERVLEQVVPPHVEACVGKVTVWQLPRLP